MRKALFLILAGIFSTALGCERREVRRPIEVSPTVETTPTDEREPVGGREEIDLPSALDEPAPGPAPVAPPIAPVVPPSGETPATTPEAGVPREQETMTPTPPSGDLSRPAPGNVPDGGSATQPPTVIEPGVTGGTP